MAWFFLLLFLVVTLLIAIWFTQRYYAKASRETALVRTGLGGQKVVIDGGCIALPILHQVQKVSMGTMVLRIGRDGASSLLTGDRLRADVEMEFGFRVSPGKDGVAAAAQILGRRISRGGEAVEDLLEGNFISAMQDAAAARSLDEIHKQRAGFTKSVADDVRPHLESLGLSLVGVSLVRVDQGSFGVLDENNAFNAEGMRKLAELVAENRKARVRIETEADIAVRESQLAQAQRRLDIERAEREAEIAQREHLARLTAEAEAVSSEKKAAASRMSQTAELDKERALKATRIAHDETLRKLEMAAILELEETRIANAMQLAQKRVEEAEIKAAEETSRSRVLLAAEAVQTEKERAVETREQEIALLRSQRESAVQEARTNREARTRLTMAEAEAKVVEATARAEKSRMQAEAQGRAALISAENDLSGAIIAMRLEERKLDRLPEIMTQMMKPVEKIDSIRINQISGMGGGGGDGGGGGGSGKDGIDGAFGAAMEQILGMAVRLPAMKQMGEEIGLGFDANLAGRTADYANRVKPKSDDKPKPDTGK